MNPIIKNTLIGIGSAVVGSVATFFITKTILDKKNEEKIQQEIDKFKATYKSTTTVMTSVSKLKQSNPKFAEILKKDQNNFKHEMESDDEAFMPDSKDRAKKKEKISYKLQDLYPREIDVNEGEDEIKDYETQLDKDYAADISETDDGFLEEDDEEYDDIDPNNDGNHYKDAESIPVSYKRPYVITVNEFEQDDKYKKVSVKYYEDDDTLTDDRDEVMHDINGTVGDDFLDHFGDLSGDSTIAYMRNEQLNIDFEVQLVHSSYAKFKNININSNPKIGKIKAYKAARKRNDN